MIEFITALMSTTGFGALIGGVGGLVNRWMDFKTKSLEIDIKKLDHAHEAAMRGLDISAMQMEVEGKIQIATIEGAATVEAAGYASLSSSYEHDSKLGNTPFTTFIRASVRPIVTFAFLALVTYINYKAWAVLADSKEQLTTEQIFEIIRWSLFEASVVIGWWFANRPSGDSGLRLPKK